MPGWLIFVTLNYKDTLPGPAWFSLICMGRMLGMALPKCIDVDRHRVLQGCYVCVYTLTLSCIYSDIGVLKTVIIAVWINKNILFFNVFCQYFPKMLKHTYFWLLVSIILYVNYYCSEVYCRLLFTGQICHAWPYNTAGRSLYTQPYMTHT